MKKLLYSKDYIKKGIKRRKTINAILFFLDVTERSLKDDLKMIDSSTKPNILKAGNYSNGKYDLRYKAIFEFDQSYEAKNANPLEYSRSLLVSKKVEEDNSRLVDEEKHMTYLKKYSTKIKTIGRILETLKEIENERIFYKEQFFKYAAGDSEPNFNKYRLNWLGTHTDFAFLIDKLIKKGFLRKGYKEILSHFVIEGEEKTEKQLTDLISKINTPYSARNISQEISSLFDIDKK